MGWRTLASSFGFNFATFGFAATYKAQPDSSSVSAIISTKAPEMRETDQTYVGNYIHTWHNLRHLLNVHSLLEHWTKQAVAHTSFWRTRQLFFAFQVLELKQRQTFNKHCMSFVCKNAWMFIHDLSMSTLRLSTAYLDPPSSLAHSQSNQNRSQSPCCSTNSPPSLLLMLFTSLLPPCKSPSLTLWASPDPVHKKFQNFSVMCYVTSREIT